MLRKYFHAKTMFVWGGLVASAFLLVFGTGSIVMGVRGKADVSDRLAQEQIVGPQDSTIPGELVDTGAEARAMADVMRMHTLESSGGLTYSQLPRYLDNSGNPTSDTKLAAKTPWGTNVDNPARTLWVTETALTTALNTSYFADQVANFVIFIGVAMVLSGIGFAVLTFGAFKVGIHRHHEEEAPAATGRLAAAH